MRLEVRYLFSGMFVFALEILLVQPAAAQQPAPTGQQMVAAAPVDRAQVENYVCVMKDEVERAEARVAALKGQLVVLDDDIESRINRVVTLLASVRDSADTSGIRIRKNKEDAIDGIKAMATYYAQERDKRRRALASPNSSIEAAALTNDLVALNARIETRVKQALDIAASLPQQGERRVDRHNDESSSETREYRKVEKDAQAAAGIKADLVADLRKGIDNLTREVAARETELGATTDPKKRELLTRDINALRETLSARRSQVEEVMTAPQADTRPVGSKGAFEMDKLFDEMVQELKQDFTKFRILVVERDDALMRLKPLKERLARATVALAAMNDGPGETGGR
jgi:hypothetical protein